MRNHNDYFRVGSALIAMCLFLSGCAVKNVTYYGEGRSPEKMVHGVIDLHMDAFGDLYPFGDFSQKFNKAENSQLFTFINNNEKACDNSKIGGYASILCSAKTRYIDATLEDVEYQESRDKWEKAQLSLWNIYASLIADQINTKNYSEVLVLVHGFNVPKPQDSFEDIKKTVLAKYETLGKAQPLVLQVSWDGFDGASIDSWQKAQASGPLAGLELRKLFNLLEKKMDVMPSFKVVTHSSGSFVIGTTLGNPVTAQPMLCEKTPDSKSEAYSWLRAYEVIGQNNPTELYRVPNLKEVKLLMIAAATPATTFTGRETADCRPVKDWYGFNQNGSELLVTQNRYDYALTKSYCLKTPLRLFLSRISAGQNTFGSSGLGSEEDHLERLKIHMAQKGISVSSADFSLLDGEKNCDHSIATYMTAPQMDSLLSLLVN